MEFVINLDTKSSPQDSPRQPKTMNTNDTPKSSQVVPVTPTSSRFINIEWVGDRVLSKFSTANGECECVPCEMSGEEHIWVCNYPSCAKVFQCV